MNSCFRLLKPTGVKRASIMGDVKKRDVADSTVREMLSGRVVVES